MGDKESNKEAADSAVAESAVDIKDDNAAGRAEETESGAAAESTESLTDGDVVESTEKSTDGTAAENTEKIGNGTTVKSTEKSSEEGSEKETAGSKVKNKEANLIKKKTAKKRIVFAVLLVAALAYFLCYTGNHKEELIRPELYTLYYEPDSQDEAQELVMENDKEYKSAVTIAEDDILYSVSVRIKPVSSDYTGELHLDIYNEEGEVVHRACFSSRDLLENTSDYAKVFYIQLPVERGEKLWLSWRVKENAGEPISLYLYDNKKGEVILDGVHEKGKSIQQQCEQYETYHWTVQLAVWIAVIVGVLLLFDNRIVRWIRHLVVAVLPLLTLYLFLIATDNVEFLNGENVLPEVIGLYLLLGIILCIFNIRGGSIFYLGFGLTITLVNHYMGEFRAQPLLLTDIFSLRTALRVADNYTYTISYPLISVVMIYVALLILMLTYTYAPVSRSSSSVANPEAVSMAADEIRRASRRKKILLRCSGGVICAAAYAGLCAHTEFVLSSWDMIGTVTERGWLMTNTMLAKICVNNKPEGYDRKQTEAFIADKSRDAVAESAVMPKNLIVIMDEAFADLRVLGDLETNQEITPFFDSLENGSRVEKGYIGVHVLGGGTASTEWEFLTGGNVGMIDIGSLCPYTFLENKTGRYNYQGICSTLSDAGYETIAMHPNLATNYGRKSVYPLLGFDDFYSTDNYYEDAERIRDFVSEEADFDGLITQYENKESDGLFVFNVTMQNHGGYSDQLEDYEVVAENANDVGLNCYLTLIHKTDQALENLIDYFNNVEEPTMIILFGDHQPSLPEYYDSIYGNYDVGKEQLEKSYFTPYLIWSNYDRQTYDKPYINVGYLEAIVKAETGMELSPWDRYLLGIMEEYPVVGQYGLYDESYTFTSYDELSEEQSQDLKQMQCAMYYWWTYH